MESLKSCHVFQKEQQLQEPYYSYGSHRCIPRLEPKFQKPSIKVKETTSFYFKDHQILNTSVEHAWSLALSSVRSALSAVRSPTTFIDAEVGKKNRETNIDTNRHLHNRSYGHFLTSKIEILEAATCWGV